MAYSVLTFPRGPDPRNGKLPRVVTHQRRQCRCLSGQDWSDRPFLTLRAHLLAAWNWGEQLLATGWFKSYPRVSRTGGGGVAITKDLQTRQEGVVVGIVSTWSCCW